MKGIPTWWKWVIISRNSQSLFLVSLYKPVYSDNPCFYRYVSTIYPWLQRFKRSFCESVFERAKPSQIDYPEYVQLCGLIRSYFQKNDYHINREFSGAEYCNNWIGLKRADNSIWLWKAATHNPTQSQRPKPAPYPIQHPGNNGGGTADSTIL